MRYTQGEWSFDPNESEFSDKHYIFCSAGKTICSIFGPHDDPEDEANGNALLIAAAPKLLETLKDISVWLTAPATDKTTIDHWKQIVSTAIAKATGEQS